MKLSDFRASETGGLTVLNLFFLITLAIFGGIAIDVSNLISSRTKLQVAADAAAHAALWTRQREEADVARARGLDIALKTMPADVYGNVLTSGDIHFGHYDLGSREFTIDESSRDAVLVETENAAGSGNAISSFLLGFIGFDNFDVVSNSVFVTYVPHCLREGYIADEYVDVTSNNEFTNGFCIHSNTYFEANNNNLYDDTVIVSMPDLDDLSLPSSGWDHNEGLEDSLRERAYALPVENWLDDWYDGMITSSHKHYRTFLGDAPASESMVLTGGGNTFSMTDLAPRTIYDIRCVSGNGKITLDEGIYDRIVIRTDCKVEFGDNVELNDTTIFTTNTNARSITAPNGLQVGRDDGCTAGGGAQLLTYGGMEFANGLKMYSGQLIALRDVEFSAHAGSVEGASILAGGHIRGTANGAVGLCGGGWESNFYMEFFRMAT